MWNKPENPVPIGNNQLRIGVFVWLDRSWNEHPFVYNKFRITSEEQLNQLKVFGSDRVYWIPSKSLFEPLPALPEKTVSPPPIEVNTLSAALKKKNEEKQRERALITKAEREREVAAKAVVAALLGLRDNPKQAGTKMRDLSSSAAQSISNGEGLLFLLGDKVGEKEGNGPQHHALNCMTLSMLIGKALGLPPAAVSEIALGALSHDVGSTMIPRHILRAKKRSSAEENLYREHCKLGAELALISGAFSKVAIEAIQDHHEALDGTGFPSGKKGISIGLAAKIVAVANCYDRLCNPESHEIAPMLPANALKVMWRDEQTRLDPAIIAALIRLLGVYPPGTIVSLNDGSLGLVISPGKNSLYPKVLIYDPDLPKEEAPIIELEEGGDRKIEESHRPVDLPEDVLSWISPRERVTYYFTANQNP
jgi:HD-GYP domain-containing protein (c-di-GMP phosphodiesterase class II)